MNQYPASDMHFVHRKDELISELSSGMLYILKRLIVFQSFFFNLVDCKVRFFTNKQEVLTLLHLKSFRQFLNLSEETRNRAAENLMAS